MPDLNDYHAFQSTSSGGGTSGGGDSGGCFTWILVVVAVLWAIGKLSG